MDEDQDGLMGLIKNHDPDCGCDSCNCCKEHLPECHDDGAGCNEREVKPIEEKPKTWKYKVRKELFGNTKFNQRSEIYKCVLSSIILVISVCLSLIEPKGIYLPWGGEFDYRIFDTLLLFIGIRMVGLMYCFAIAAIMPWIHVAIDGAHSPISMVGFMITDILCVFVFWLIYYRVFHAGLDKMNDCCNEDIKESDSLVGVKHKHRFQAKSWAKRISAVIVIVVICCFIEALAQIGVFALLIAGDFTPGADEKDQVDGLRVFFKGLNILWLTLFFAAIFSVKYIVECAIFIVIEKRTTIIADHYGVF